MPMFLNDEHQKTYLHALKEDETHPHDCERQALFYLLTLSPTTRNHLHELYDFKDHAILSEGLKSNWQTNSSSALTQLAFTLYNDFQETLYTDIEAGDLLIMETPDYGETLYTEKRDTHLYFRHPMYTTQYQSFSLLQMFAPIDRDLFPYLYEAINIRFNLVNGLA